MDPSSDAGSCVGRVYNKEREFKRKSTVVVAGARHFVSWCWAFRGCLSFRETEKCSKIEMGL